MSKKTLCIYHADCADGFAAAWVVRKALGIDTTNFHPANYGDEAPMELVGEGDDIMIVDFSYPEEELRKLSSVAGSVMIIDHHESAERRLEKFTPEAFDRPEDMRNVRAWFDMDRSGAMMTWDFFFPGKKPPALLSTIQDRDLWRWELHDTAEVMEAVFSYEYDFEFWDRLMNTPHSELRREGAALLRRKEKDINDLLPRLVQVFEIGGIAVPAVNMSRTYRSEAGNKLCRNEPFAAVYWMTNDGKVEFALRSDRNTPKHMNVAQIAEQYGGGGHQNAAGFTVEITSLIWNSIDLPHVCEVVSRDTSTALFDGLGDSKLVTGDFEEMEKKVVSSFALSQQLMEGKQSTNHCSNCAHGDDLMNGQETPTRCIPCRNYDHWEPKNG